MNISFSYLVRGLAKLTLLAGILSLTGCSHFMQPKGNKEKAGLYLQKAADALSSKAYKPALSAASKALEHDPQNAAAYNQMALIFLETKRYDRSREAFKKAFELQPNFPEAFNNYGVLLDRIGKHKSALGWFKKALASRDYSTPENAYTNMGRAYYKLKDYKKAKQLHQQALDISPTFCLASKNLADVHAKEGNFNAAVRYYRAASVNCLLYQEAHYKLGLALAKNGEKKMATQQLKKLVRRHRRGEYVERSNRVLKFLEK